MQVKRLSDVTRTFTMYDLQNVVIKGMHRHEEFWNKEAYRCERERRQREWNEECNHGRYEIFIGPNPSRYYELTIGECFEIECKKHNVPIGMARLFDLANHWYNDLYDWANCVWIDDISGESEIVFQSVLEKAKEV